MLIKTVFRSFISLSSRSLMLVASWCDAENLLLRTLDPILKIAQTFQKYGHHLSLLWDVLLICDIFITIFILSATVHFFFVHKIEFKKTTTTNEQQRTRHRRHLPLSPNVRSTLIGPWRPPPSPLSFSWYEKNSSSRRWGWTSSFWCPRGILKVNKTNVTDWSILSRGCRTKIVSKMAGLESYPV